MALDKLRRRLVYLHDKKDMVWRKIAEMPEFNNVSYGTLNNIYNGGEPTDDEIRRRLGLDVVELIPQIRDEKTGQFSARPK